MSEVPLYGLASCASALVELYTPLGKFQHLRKKLPPANREIRTASQFRCRGTSPIRKRTPLGPYRRPMSRVLGWS